MRHPPHRVAPPVTADVRRSPRRGTPSACATKRMHPRHAREIVALHSETRPSLGPSTRARQSSLCTAAQASVVGRRSGIAVGQPRASEKNQHRGCFVGRSAARHVPPRPQGRRRGMKEKEEGRGLRPCEDSRARGLVARTSCQLQKSLGDVWSRIRSSKRAPKRAAVSSEQGPSAEQTSAGETVGGGIVRREQSRIGLTPL
jgi:hypothetical protein